MRLIRPAMAHIAFYRLLEIISFFITKLRDKPCTPPGVSGRFDFVLFTCVRHTCACQRTAMASSVQGAKVPVNDQSESSSERIVLFSSQWGRGFYFFQSCFNMSEKNERNHLKKTMAASAILGDFSISVKHCAQQKQWFVSSTIEAKSCLWLYLVKLW